MIIDEEAYVKHEYDPQKAHEYYVRTRLLKGRQTADGKDPVTAVLQKTGKQLAPKAPVFKPPPVKKKQVSVKTTTEIRVAALKVRLDQMRTLLKELLRQAKSRSGVAPTPKKEKADATPGKNKGKSAASAKDRKPLTAAEKADKAKKAKELYDKNNTEQGLEKQIEVVKQKIAKAQEELKAAVDKGRSTATKSAR